MRVVRLENLSLEVLDINLTGGGMIKLPSGGIIENVNVVNIDELRYKASIVFDLSEIDEKRRNKTSAKRLND